MNKKNKYEAWYDFSTEIGPWLSMIKNRGWYLFIYYDINIHMYMQVSCTEHMYTYYTTEQWFECMNKWYIDVTFSVLQLLTPNVCKTKRKSFILSVAALQAQKSSMFLHHQATQTKKRRKQSNSHLIKLNERE